MTDSAIVRWLPHLFAVHASEGRWRCYPYFKLIGEKIREAISNPDGGRLIINMPPRHGKSKFIHFWVPVWFLDSYPERSVITASHTARLSSAFGRLIRNEFSHNPFLRAKLSQDSKAANIFHTTEGGGLTTAGVDTGLTGFGGDLAIVDDPYRTRRDAASELYRNNLLEWWQYVLMTRLEPKATVILMHHRWRDDDLTSYLLEESEDRERWQHISLPALAMPGDPLGRAPGEALCPERYDERSLAMKRLGLGPSWDPMYQQAANARDGDLAYPHFEQANIDAGVKYRPELPLQLAYDFNINPGMHCTIGQYDRRTDNFTCLEEIYEPRLRNGPCTELAAMKVKALIKEADLASTEVHVFGDPSGSSGSMRADGSAYDEITATLRAKGLRKIAIRTTPAAPPVVDRVRATNDACRDADGTRHYHVHPRCEGTIRCFRNTKVDDNEKLVKRNNSLTHFTDGEGYRIDYQRPVGIAQAKSYR